MTDYVNSGTAELTVPSFICKKHGEMDGAFNVVFTKGGQAHRYHGCCYCLSDAIESFMLGAGFTKETGIPQAYGLGFDWPSDKEKNDGA